MKLKKAIKTLKKHQKWRLGAVGTEQSKPIKAKKLTEAINIVLYGLELQLRYIKSVEIEDFEELKKL